jgi:hypothetical protein
MHQAGKHPSIYFWSSLYVLLLLACRASFAQITVSGPITASSVTVDHDFRVNLRSKLSSNTFNPEEIEANIFAAELLMPAECLQKDLTNKDIDAENDETIKDLRQRYQVSGQALVYRLANLGLLHTTGK